MQSLVVWPSAHLGVNDDGASLLDVGAGVNVDVADAVRVAQDGNLGVLLDVRHLHEDHSSIEKHEVVFESL